MNSGTWLPNHVDKRVRVMGWLTLCAQIAIVATGGLVRLTASGLGCPSWPTCTPNSLVNTPEIGIHGVIEFGNRLLTFLLVIIAVLTFLSVVRTHRKDLLFLAIAIALGIPAQAFIGGFSVLTHLNPYVVGLHFVVSIVLIVLATLFVHRIYGPLPSLHPSSVPATQHTHHNHTIAPWYSALAIVLTVFVGVTILLGILTTGSGPHAGDAAAPRNGLNSEFLQHIHSWSSYITFALTVSLFFATIVLNRHSAFTQRSTARWIMGLLIIEIAQMCVGIIQANTALPAPLVEIHLTLACILASLTTMTLLYCTTSTTPRLKTCKYQRVPHRSTY